MNIVVIGGNAAGMSFAAKYKRNVPNDNVIVLESRDYVSFGGCGLPYFVGRQFNSNRRLFARSVEATIESGIDLRINSIVTNVNKVDKVVSYTCNDVVENISYDKLIICSGANPIVPDFGIYNKDRVTTLTSMADGHKLRGLLDNDDNKSIAIIGGGFIGLEVMDAAHELGKEITLIERDVNVLANQYSPEMIEVVEEEIKDSGISLLTNTSVEGISDIDNQIKITTDKGDIVVDVVVMSIGFRPNTSFIEIDKAPNGAIIVNEKSETNIEDIYAIGDCSLIYNYVKDHMDYIPLATGANKQGRMVADYLGGNKTYFKGLLGSSCLKVLDYELANTGINEKQAIKLGINYKTKFVKDNNQTDYCGPQYPIYAKITYDPDTLVILGCEMIGKKGVVGRINTIAVAIYGKVTTQELGYMDFCYAPPFSRTWDMLNVIGNVSK